MSILPLLHNLRRGRAGLSFLASILCLVPASLHAADLSSDVRRLLNDQCTSCHGGVKRAGGVSFIVRETTLKPAKSGETAVRPGDPEASELMRRVLATDDDERMPPPEHGPRLSESAIALLRRWIAAGAPWQTHWAYVPPRPPKLPSVSNLDWCRQPLDRFVLARLDAAGLRPAPPADRVAWLRRVSFDLIGLPPSLEEVRHFVADTDPTAFEKVVDRLLQSSRFGERWASPWLDLARYADSQGYEKDGGRTIWPYRDWLIRSFNADMPFDQFTVRQLAGDLLPNPSLEDLIATGFHRNTPTNTEGGTDDEEFRIAAVLDRVATTWKSWQGISFNCVQCHSHPYEPIDHDEFYRFMALFNTSRDWDLTSDLPVLKVPVRNEDFGEARSLDERIRALRGDEFAVVTGLRRRMKDWVPLTPSAASSTLQTKLVIRPALDHGAEVLTEGTVSHDSEFTIDLPMPTGLNRLTALRIEVLPRNPSTAVHSPELGFVLSHVRAQWVTPENEMEVLTHEQSLTEAKRVLADAQDEDAKKKARQQVDALENHRPATVTWAYALGDEREPFQDAGRSLHPDQEGWGALPRITHARCLVLVPESVVEIPTQAKLRLVMRQEAAPNDMLPLVMGRSRYSLSTDSAWVETTHDESFVRRREAWKELFKKREAIRSAAMPYMSEQYSPLARATAVFVRGNWINKGDAVQPGVPKIFPPLPSVGAPNRLAMARWLVSSENPLTSRVAVNRFWELLFGIGLVETVEDFGSSGEAPSHPELLDDLAVRFQGEMGWSIKTLLREMVLSATYRQDAKGRSGSREKDPRNRMLSRGPRNRLTAEMVRDNALAIAGLLSSKIYGPSVMPWQPEGIWRAARSNMKWKTSAGEDAYRRAVYTYWRRSSPYPSLITFDAPNRLVCSARRVVTSTPLQALVTMNDPVFLECAQALAVRMREGCEDSSEVSSAIEFGYEAATGHRPNQVVLQELQALYESANTEYQAETELIGHLGDSSQEAALVLVANAILNLDEVLSK